MRSVIFHGRNQCVVFYFAFLIYVAHALLVSVAKPLNAAEVLKSELILSGGLLLPNFGATPAGDYDHLYISEQRSARLLRLDLQTKQLVEVLNLPNPDPASGTQTGLNGFAFHPDFANNGKVYVQLSGNAAGDIRILEYTRSATDPNVFDPTTEREILTLPNPTFSHNSGWIGFGPQDGYLYLGTGDGGNVPPNETKGINAQNVNSLQGKMLRIDVDGADSYPADDSRNYAIPENNPFAAGGGAAEVFALGLRHPFRNSFDRETGDLYVGDVGSNLFEEINVLPAGTDGGQNYGWRPLEGFVDQPQWPDPPPENPVYPVYAYSHNGASAAVIGGYVYRGSEIPSLQGTYFFGDFIKKTLFSFRYDGSDVTEIVDRTKELVSPLGSYGGIASFAEDAAGELYMLDYIQGNIYRIAARNFISADFSGGAVPNDLEQSPLNTAATFDGSAATFPGVGAAGRSYLRTVDDDLHTTSFTAEVNVTLSGAGEAGSGFFGLGVGDPHSGLSEEPRTGAHVFMRVDPSALGGDVLLVDNGVDIDPATSSEAGDGTHRLRINYDAITKQIQFVIGDVSSGRFVPTSAFGTIDTSDNGFDGTNARLFFGGADGITFDDLSHRYFEGLDSLWTGALDSNFGTTTNWSPEAVPDSSTNLFFTDTAANFTVDLGGDRIANSATFAGASDYTLNNDTLSLSTGDVAVVGSAAHAVNSNITILSDGVWDIGAGATLTLNGALSDGGGGFGIDVTGGGTLILTGTLNNFGTGSFNDGTVNASSGATLSTGNIVMAGTTGSSAVLTITGDETAWTAADLVVGDSGTASMTIDGGAEVLAENVAVANAVSATGVLSVADPGTTLVANDIALAVNGGSGTINVTGTGATLMQAGASGLTVGQASTGTATITVEDGAEFNTGTGAVIVNATGGITIDGGTLNLNGDTTVDGGTITQSNGGVLNLASGRTLIAQNDAQLNFTGNEAIDNNTIWTLQTGADYNTTSPGFGLDVGDGTDGTLVVENPGSSLNLDSSSTSSIGENGATGTVTIRDGATATYGLIDIAAGNTAGTTGVLNIEDGASVSTPSIVRVASTGGDTNSGTINIGGTSGTATLTIGSTLFVGAIIGSGTVNLNSGGLLNTGLLTDVRASGLIDINGGTLDLNGDLTINGGEVRRQAGSILFEPDSNVTLSNGGVLDITGTLEIDQGVVLTVNSGSAYSSSSFTRLGSSGDGTLIVDGAGSSATMSAGFLIVGQDVNTGHAIFRNGATGSATGATIVNSGASTGLVEVESGASLTISGDVHLNEVGAAGSSGTLTVTGAGSNVTLTGGGAIDIGQTANGTATLNVLAGGTFTKNSGDIDLHPTGTINLDGGFLVVDTISDLGGTFNYIGGSLAMVADLTVSPSGLLKTNDLVLSTNDAVATAGTATIDALSTLTLAGGAFTADTLVNNGTFAFQSGSLTITGAGGLTIGTGGPLGSVVSLGAGQLLDVTNTLSLDAGATMVIGTGASVEAGTLANGGSVVLDGPAAALGGTTVSNSGLIRGEGVVSANVTNNAGGELRAQAGKTLTLAGTSGLNAGLISLLGGTLEFSQPLVNDSTGQITGRGVLDVGTTGLTNNGHIALSSGISDIFGDVENDTGNTAIGVSVSGNADVTFWDDVNNVAGSLFRVSAGSSATFFGTFSGAGISGTGDVYLEADITPGSSPAVAVFGGGVALGSNADLVIELGGLTPGSEHDQLDVAGLLTLDGTLDVLLINGFMPAAGQSFDILDWGTRSGEFDTVNLPTLAGLNWNTSQLYTTGVLSLAAAGLLGDYSGNGIVDAADYTVWRDALTAGATSLTNDPTPGTVDEGDFTYWRAHFGETLGSGSGARQAAVPEPASVVLLILAGAGWSLRRRRAA